MNTYYVPRQAITLPTEDRGGGSGTEVACDTWSFTSQKLSLIKTIMIKNVYSTLNGELLLGRWNMFVTFDLYSLPVNIF